MKKSIYLISIFTLMLSFACKNNSDIENHDPNPLVSPTSIDATSGEDIISFHLVCSENPDGAYLYDEDGDNVTVVIDPETPLPDDMSFNEETGVIIVYRRTDLSGTLRFWTVDDMDGSTEDQPLTVTYNITQWTAEPGETAVYVAGYYAGSPFDVSSYWINDISNQTDLYDTENSRVNSIFVSGGDIYVAGFYTNGDGNKVACYWLNGGLPIDFFNETTAGYHAEAYDIYVSGSDIYVSGFYEEGDGVRVACYWVNSDDPISFSPVAGKKSEINSIYYDGTDIYAAGYYVDGSDIEKACYWKNTARTDLSPTDWGRAESITVQNNTVYTSGWSDDGGKSACYWANSSRIILHNSSISIGNSIFVNGSDIYVAGSYKNGAYFISCYWLNGGDAIVLYDETASEDDSVANSIFVSESDIYIAGYYSDSDPYIKSCYWKNNVLKTLSDGASFHTYATSIFVND
ncbi:MULTISPECIES: hypothetical protein [unclassified Oceanispirochaeta]|uniref:hypothetical protein n=1 Tax=unclassified Oceanispirochaeta TaxID=2635722 RepID=UPI000E090C7B|nr:MULTISPECIES: hypothetical protein [unclassified Oceanispirochaeta]MBF9015532.1 hypothetical protein [Oceanispirochaeta sp. M2]NPD71991.1 hypothetical protein [Oceanispirochaeta sp. M1]RDG32797.1 hypothetical protein DV872_07755 [Oceanispirochaeta sp. M1]